MEACSERGATPCSPVARFDFAERDPKRTQIPADILLQSTGLAAASAVDELRKY